MANLKRAYCLYRVSTKGQVDHNDIPMQRIACNEYAEKNGWVVVKEFLEKGVSGFKTSADDRDAIQDLKAAAIKNEFDILLVYMFDRLGRREDETPFVVEWFTKNGVEVWSTQEGEQRFDNHVDKLMNYIRFWQASGESIKTSTRIKTRLEQLTEEGRYTGGNYPLGYNLVHNGQFNKKGVPLKELEVNEAEAAIVKMIFEKTINEGIGSHRLAEILNRMGIRTHGGSKLQSNTIIRILKNFIYCGYLLSGDAVSPHLEHLQIIDKATFTAAQNILVQRSTVFEGKKNVALNTKGNTLLSGNIYCAHCNSRMVASSYYDKYTTLDGVEHNTKKYRYICYHKSRKLNNCKGQAAYVSTKIDKAVTECLNEYFDCIKMTPRDKALEFRYQEQMKQEKALLKKAQKDREKHEQGIHELMSEISRTLTGDSAFTKDILASAIDSEQKAIQNLNLHIAELQGALLEKEEAFSRLDYDYRQFVGWAEEFKKATLEQRKMIVCHLIKEVRVSRGYKIDIIFNLTYRQFLGSLASSFNEKIS